MHNILFFLVLVLFSSVYADPKDAYSLAVTEGAPESLIEGRVSAITGDLYLAKEDGEVQGYIPLRLPRHYLSGDGKGRLAGWSFFSHLTASYRAKEAEHTITLSEINGSTFTFKCPAEEVYSHFRKEKHIPKFLPPNPQETPGFTNTARREMGAHSNIKNGCIRLEQEGKYFTVHCPDQTIRRYKIHQKHKHFKDIFKKEAARSMTYLLEAETLASGHKVIYDYDKHDQLRSVRTTSPNGQTTYASATFHYHNGHDLLPDVDVSFSDGRTLRYLYENKSGEQFVLAKIFSPEAPEESISYHPKESHTGHLVNRVSLSDLGYYDIDYYWEGAHSVGGREVTIKDHADPRFLRVKNLKAPVGTDEQALVTHTFFYEPEQRYTDVRELDNALTRYRYSPAMRLESIERFDAQGTFWNKESFKWSDAGEITGRTFHDTKGAIVLSRRFFYDGRGNSAKEEFSGNLSGTNPLETYTIKREYSQEGRDLLLKEEEQNGKVTLYTYAPHSNLVTGKFLSYANTIRQRTFYEYNGNHVLVRKIEDDGTTQDKNDLSPVKTRTLCVITPMTSGPYVDLPHVIEEKYWDGSREILLKKKVLTYATGGQIAREEIYDATGTFHHALNYTYDGLGHLLTETNALGETTTYTYDAAGNQKTITTSDGKLLTIHTYDHSRRLIQTEEKGSDGTLHITSHRYDGKHNKTETTDTFGNTTRYVYDSFGRRLTTHLPSVLDEKGNATSPILASTYDSAGREITRLDAQGALTMTHYNARSQPTSIEHPNGTKEHFLYNLDGTLKTHTDQEGHTTTHTYDPFGRCLSTQDALQQTTTYIYDSLHLIAMQDPEGYTTTYTYDGAGRKIREERHGERIDYHYDNLNRISCVQKGDLFEWTEYDPLDRVTQEREEDQAGHIFSQVNYIYDSSNNLIEIIRSVMGQTTHEQFAYDLFHRLLSHTDPSGYTTYMTYEEQAVNGLDQRVLRKITTDPLNQKTIETSDSLGRNISTQIQTPEGTLCSLEEKFYDKNGNLSRQLSTLFPQKIVIEKRWEYDNLNRLIALFEPQGKITRYTYTPKGLLKEIIKPDQVILANEYDANCRLLHLFSSDRSVDYTFTYNALGQLISSKDLLTQASTTRTLDAQGRILTETLPNGLSFTNTYDLKGRRTQLLLPDQGNVTYTYDPLHLRAVTRYSPSGTPLYTHAYTSYDLSNHLLSEELIHNLGQVTYTISPKGKTASTTSSYFSQQVTRYDPVGNITSLASLVTLATQTEPTTYTYDPLYQLTQEKGPISHTYAYDSHHNRIQKDNIAIPVNALNQITLPNFTYDTNGNPRLSNDLSYTYDALDRVIEVRNQTHRLLLSYDSFHRRISKIVYARTHDIWDQISRHFYLYDGQNEIGVADAAGNLLEFRTLGATPDAEIGAAVAIEIEGTIYAPLHDLFGNITTLIASDGTLAASYRYDSFGNHTATHKLANRWRFASQRLDETGLIYYGRRYYDPSLGRWTTTDPLGRTAGINPYAFVQNNPLVH